MSLDQSVGQTIENSAPFLSISSSDFAGEHGARTTPFTNAAWECPEEDLAHPLDAPALVAALAAERRVAWIARDPDVAERVAETLRAWVRDPDGVALLEELRLEFRECSVTRILVDRADPNVALIAYTGFNQITPSTPGHIFRAVFNPATDTALPSRFDAEDASNKGRCKSAVLGELSLETQVTAATPPTFLYNGTADTLVSPENSFRFYLALRKAGVPTEVHPFENGAHATGLRQMSVCKSAVRFAASAFARATSVSVSCMSSTRRSSSGG